MKDLLRIVIADDERPARSYLSAMLNTFEDVRVVAEASDGAEAIEAIEREKPDLALLDLQMPEVDGLSVVRLVDKARLPLIAFVTAYDEYAVRAFELNAVDYLLKPVERGRLAETLNRTRERLESAAQSDDDGGRQAGLRNMIADFETNAPREFLERLPIRTRDEILLLPTRRIASVVAEGELMHIHTTSGEHYVINQRLKDLEARLDPTRFVRLSRGTLANRELIERISPLPGGTYTVTLSTRQQLHVSRTQSRVLREQLLKL